jgi:hypothetical protein
MYANIPIKETREIIANNLDKNKVETHIKQTLLKWYDTITKKNYFSNNGKILIQQEGLAMGAPTSGIIAVFFLQHLEDTHLSHLLQKHNIAGYFRYVDDILIIYDSLLTDIDSIRDSFNTVHPNMKFTAETESNNRLNFLDITIHRTPSNWVTSIHRKHTFTDTLIPYSSNHPTQHKFAAVWFLYNRLNTYLLQKNEYEEELSTIQDILSNNSFPIHTHKPPTQRKPTTTLDKGTYSTTHKWMSFTYVVKKPPTSPTYLKRQT